MIGKQKVKITKRGYIKNHTFEGVGTAKELIPTFNDVIIYFDPDVDGCIAGLLACRYCAKHGIKFSWYINSNRSHDWSIPTDVASGKNIIAVDFIITAEKIIELCDAGCNIVSMDHHVNRQELIDYESDYGTRGVVINNQYPFEDQDGRYLSGAGVVFETLIQLDPEMDTVENRALVGITLLSDVREIENPLAEYYLYLLYSHKYKGYIKYLIDHTMGEVDYGFGLPQMDRSYVDYKFSPAINACLRFNEQDQVVNFFLGSHVLDLSCRDNQKALVKNIMKVLKVVDFDSLRVCYFYEKDFMKYSDVLSSFVGLVASKNLDGKHSVICYMIGGSEGSYYLKRASFRGNINGMDYQKSLSVLYKCLGHKSAFGIKGINPSKKVFSKSNELIRELEDKSPYKRKVIEVVNMSFFVSGGAYEIAENNLYSLSQNQVYIKYKGNSIQRKRSGANYAEYLVNGIPVMCFDLKQTFEDGLIVPILERGLLTFYLQ